jgi:uncharacterized protein YukE
MGEFTVRPEDLQTAGKAMDAAGGDLHQQWQQLKAATSAIKFGSTDMVSPLIQMTLMGAVAIADSCFGSSKDALTNHSDALHNAAQHYSDAEASSAALFKAQ